MKRPWLDGLLVVGLVGGGVLVAYRLGGGAEPPVAPPQPEPRATAAPRATASGCVRLLFVGGARKRRVSGRLVATTSGAALSVELVGLAETDVRRDEGAFDLSFETRTTQVVGVVARVTPLGSALSWSLLMDDEPLPRDHVFGGPYGLVSPSLEAGLLTSADWRRALAPTAPEIDPRREVGLFVAAGCDLESAPGDNAARLE